VRASSSETRTSGVAILVRHARSELDADEGADIEIPPAATSLAIATAHQVSEAHVAGERTRPRLHHCPPLATSMPPWAAWIGMRTAVLYERSGVRARDFGDLGWNRSVLASPHTAGR
jgi:hypothetical protein